MQYKVEIFTFGMCVCVCDSYAILPLRCRGIKFDAKLNSSDEANVRPFIRNSVLPWQLKRGGVGGGLITRKWGGFIRG